MGAPDRVSDPAATFRNRARPWRKNVERVIERLKVRFNETGFKSRRIEIGEGEDEAEADVRARWSDGLPLCRRPRSACAHARRHQPDPQEVIGWCRRRTARDRPRRSRSPGDGRMQARNTCRRVAAVEAVLTNPLRCMGCWRRRSSPGRGHRQRHGAPPDRDERQGQRARPGQPRQHSIGRALQLVIRNIGEDGRRRSTAQRSATRASSGMSLPRRGRLVLERSRRARLQPGTSAVTVFAALGCRRHRSEIPHPGKPGAQHGRIAEGDAKRQERGLRRGAVVCPEHERTFREAGWRRHDIIEEVTGCARSGRGWSMAPAASPKAGPLARGKDRQQIPPGGLMIVRARRRRRDVFRHHRRLVLGRPRQRPHTRGHN